MSENGVIDAEQTQAHARNGSRFNAVKHGLFARSAVLPGEDLDEFQARVEMYIEGLNPRNELQEDLSRKAALASWQHDRAVVAEKSRAESELEALEKEASRERLEALQLGSRLLFDRRGANEMYASHEYHSRQPKTSFSNDPCDPDQPERLVLQLEETVAGCRVLLQHWDELRGLLERGQAWQSREKLVVSRLLGMQPIHVVHKSELAKIFLACHVIEPQFKSAFRELRCELDENSYNRYRACLSRREVDELTPADATAARAFLLKVVDDAKARLRAIEAGLQKKWEENQARARALIGLGISKTGEQIRRAQGSFNRLLLRNVDAVRRVQREDDRGWEVVRKAREERKALRREKNKREWRMVLDPHGIVRDAAGYEGDLEAGLERYERKFGPQTDEATVERNMRQAIPDYARWRAPADLPDQTRGGSGGPGLDLKQADLASANQYGAEMAEMQRRAEARAEREIAAERAEAEQAEAKLRNEGKTSAALPAVDVTLIVTETIEQENIRNEIEGAGRSRAGDGGEGMDIGEGRANSGGPELYGGNAVIETPNDGGAREFKVGDRVSTQVIQSTAGVPVILTEPVEQGNVRNEIGDEELGLGMKEGDGAGSEEEDEVLPNEGVLEEVEQISSSGADGKERIRKGKKPMSGPPDMVDESLEEIKWLLPNAVRFLKEQRKLL